MFFGRAIACSQRYTKERITYKIKPEIFDEKRGSAALLIKNSGFYFIFLEHPKRAKMFAQKCVSLLQVV